MTSTFMYETEIREYWLPAKCYPRYRYFQKHLEGLLPELQEMEEYVSLPTIEQLTDRYKWTDHVFVRVVCSRLCEIKPLTNKLMNVQVDVDKPYSYNFNDDDWEKEQRKNIDNSVPDITVFVLKDSKECMYYWKKFLTQTMSEKRLNNVVLHNEEIDASSTYKDMVKNCFQYRNVEDDESLSSKIQYILEYKVVSVLEEVVKNIEVAADNLKAKCKDFSELPRPDKMPYHEKETFGDECIDGKQSSTFKKKLSEKDVKKIKETMKTLKFEIFGLLKQTRIDLIRTGVPIYPKLSSGLQKDILGIPEIIGCGTAYGKLVIHISRKTNPEGPSDEIENKVKQLLQEREYSNGYSIELIGEIKESRFTQGDEIEATSRDGKEKDFGTLGCFVNVENVETNIKKLYGITCAHCVKDYNPMLKINSNKESENIGTLSQYVYWENFVDIAAIEISQDYYEDCDKSFILNDEICENWTFQEEGDRDLYSGLKVYKNGSTTGFTQGQIVSIDYLVKSSQEKMVSREERSIVITKSKKQTKGCFSAPGDSGSAVWVEFLGQSKEPVVMVIGLLSRATYGRNGLTFCCPIVRSIHELEGQFGQTINITPAR